MMYKDRIGKICIDSNYISSSSIMKLSDCKNIEKIYFGKNYNDNLRNVFSGMINLREIEVGHDAQLSILTLSYLAVTNKKLIYVDISNSKIIDKDIEGLSGMKTLEYLHLQNTSITDKAIELLSTQYHPILKVLDVNETAITDKAIPFFAKMKGLENLQINKTKISKDGFRKLEKLMPNCGIVYGVIVPN